MIWILSKHSKNEYENRRLIEEFEARNVAVKLVHPNNFNLVVDENAKILYEGEIANPDLILVRTGSGTDFFTSCVLKQFQLMGVKCVNTPESIELAKDKFLAAQRLTVDHISTPKTILVRFPVDEDLVKKEIGFPCVVKPTNGSYGTDVVLCNDVVDFIRHMETLKHKKNRKEFIIQEYVGFKKGTDIRVIVIAGKVIGAMQRTNDNDFRANIAIGGYGAFYPIDNDLESLALQASDCIGLEISGVDVLFTQNGYSILEINSAPGFKGFTSYTAIDVGKLIVNHIVEMFDSN